MKKMYLLGLTFLLTLSALMATAAQSDDSICLPKAEEISKITFDKSTADLKILRANRCSPFCRV